MSAAQRRRAAVCWLALWGWMTASAQAGEAVRVGTAEGLPSTAVHQVVQDRPGYLWFATNDGLARYDGRQFRSWRREQGLADTAVSSLAVDAQDQLWLGGSEGALMRMSADRSRIDRIGASAHPALAGRGIVALLPDDDGGAWLGTRGAGLLHLTKTDTLHQYLPARHGGGVPAQDVTHLARDGDGDLWVGTPHGLVRWRAGRFHPPSEPALATANITGLHRDAAGRVWVSSSAGRWYGQGNLPLRRAPAHPRARLLGIGRDGAHWLAEGHRHWWQPAAGSHATPGEPALAGTQEPPALGRVVEDRQGAAWLLGQHHGTWRLPPLWRQFQHARPVPPRRSLGNIVATPGDSSGEVQCAGPQYWRVHGTMLERRSGGRRPPARWSLPALGVPLHRGHLSLQCTDDGGAWLAGPHGLLRWTAQGVQRIADAPADVTALHVDAHGRVWLAAGGALGGYRWSETGLRRTVRVDRADGLPASPLYGLAADGDGLLWATSATGLVRIAPAQREVRVYARDDGIPAALLKATLQRDGAWMTGTGRDGGSVAFEPARWHAPVPPPPLVIARVQLRRGGQLVSLPIRATLQLHANDRDIQITAQALSAQSHARQQYRFRLQGEGAAWSRTRYRGTIGFARLAPGRHLLEYQQRAGDGAWSAGQTLVLDVQPGQWQHPVLRWLVTAAALALAGWAGWRAWAHRRARQAAAQRQAWAVEAAQAKTRYLATLGHEVRTPLTGVLGMTELLLGSVPDPQQRMRLAHVQAAGRQLLGMVDQTLDAARVEAGRMPRHPCRFDLPGLLAAWHRQMQCGASAGNGAWSLHLHLPGACTVLADPQQVQHLLQQVVDALHDALSACCLRVCVDWLPGRGGVRVDVLAQPLAGLPLPASDRLDDLARHVRASVQALQGQLRTMPAGRQGWRVVLSLPLQVCDGAPGTVLVVEDDPTVAEVHAAMLVSDGMQVLLAGHALAALAQLAAHAVDVVLLDLDLPGVDGWQLLGMLRAQGHLAPVVVVTACATPALAARVAAAGAHGPLLKPVSADALQAAVRAARAG